MSRKAQAKKNESMHPPTATPRSQPEPQTDAGGPISTNTTVVLPESDNQLPSSKKKAKVTSSVVRRSVRIQVTSPNQEIEPVIEDMGISDGDIEDAALLHKESSSLEGSPDDTGRASPDGIPSAADVKYRRMYINSQKKAQELIEENIELSKKLENAMGKTRMFEENRIYPEIWTTISSMAQATELAVTLIAEAIHGSASIRTADNVEPEAEAAKAKRAAAEDPTGRSAKKKKCG